MSDAARQETSGSLPDEMSVLYDRYGPAAYRLALHRVRDRDLAADVVQEAFLSLWRARHNFQPERGAVGGLLCTLVHRRAVELLRRRAAWPATEPLDQGVADTLLDDADGPDQLACDHDQEIKVLEALDKLTPAKRQAVRLAWLYGYRATEIAALLGIPRATVKTRLLTARSQLRILLPREALDV